MDKVVDLPIETRSDILLVQGVTKWVDETVTKF